VPVAGIGRTAHRSSLTEHRSINAVVESFFGTLKKELIYRRSWPTRNEVAAAVHEYIEVFYNRRRRHTTNGGKAPAIYEALAQRQLTQAA
jgi:transposase InsO family protein